MEILIFKIIVICKVNFCRNVEIEILYNFFNVDLFFVYNKIIVNNVD